MYRRTILDCATGTLASLSGCTDAILGTPTPVDELPSVRVVASGYGALSPVQRWTLRVEEDRLEHVVICRTNEGTIVESEDLAAKQYRETQRLVDGDTYETVVDPVRDPPAGIDRLQDHLEPYWDRFDRGLNACE